jgi:hypothetical protein
MTRDESLEIVSMIINFWHSNKEWTKEEIDVYARLIQDMDAELTMSALTKAAKEIAYRPAISELRERVRVEKRRLAPTVAPPATKATPLPHWVKRWICARMLYKQFGKDQDLRRFPEQGDWGDLTMEVMPEGAW